MGLEYVMGARAGTSGPNLGWKGLEVRPGAALRAWRGPASLFPVQAGGTCVLGGLLIITHPPGPARARQPTPSGRRPTFGG